MTIEEVKQSTLDSIKSAVAAEAELYARAYKTLCEAEGIEAQTVYTKKQLEVLTT